MSGRKVSPEEGLLQRSGVGPWHSAALAQWGVGSLPSEPGGRLQEGQEQGGGVNMGPDKEMALTLQCQMPRKVAGVRLKVFRLFLLLLGSLSPKSKEPPPWRPESDAPCPEGWTLMPIGEGPLQVSCAVGQCACVCAGMHVCVCASLCRAEGGVGTVPRQGRAITMGGEPWALGLTDVVSVPLSLQD